MILLKDRGHHPDVQIGEDEDTQELAVQVRRSNPNWKPGQAVRLPDPPAVVHGPPLPAPVVRTMGGPVAPTTRPRERRARRVSGSSRGSPDDEPEPGGAGRHRLGGVA
jgi:hypothetical protein